MAALAIKDAPSAGSGDEEADFLSLSTLRRQFETYASEKAEEIEEAKVARRYYNHVQWTAEQVEIFRKRRQPVVTFPRIGRKIDGIVGIAEQQRQDPKAYPRNPENAEGADVATCVVRYVTERNEWATKKPQALRQAMVDGIAGIELRLVQGDEEDPDIELEPVQTDDFFYDPRSIRPNFTDARFMGLAKQLDVDEAVELFPDKAEVLRSSSGASSEFLIDSDRKVHWHATNRQILLVEHWYKWKGKWRWAFYVGWDVLAQGVSPFLDERGKTICRFEMFSAYVDQDGDRYGLVRALKSMQDEINHRRGNALFRANAKRLIGEIGAVDDIEKTRREWARPDGVILKNKGYQLEPDGSTQADLVAQFKFLEDARNEMEAYANVNPAALSGGNVNLSGRAVNLLQKPGIAELGPLLIGYRNWVIRVYRSIWNTAQRNWTAERWIRVTDDQKLEQFVRVNGLTLDQFGRPSLVNALGALDVDIVLDEGPDVQNMMQDAWGVLSQLPPGVVPPDILVQLMPIEGRIKDAWLAKMQPAAPDPLVALAKQLELKKTAGEIDETNANAVLKHAQALSALGSAAHKGSEAHLDAADIFTNGLRTMNADNVAVQPAPVAPAPPPPMPAGLPPMAPPSVSPGFMSPY